MERRKVKNVAIFIAILLFIVGWTILLYYYSPSEIVEWLGVTNSYLVAFLMAVFGAIASMTPVSTYPAIYTMASGGVSPLLLAPIAAIGLTVGDMIFVYFGLSAREALSEKFQNFVERVLRWLNEKPTLFIQVFVFVWVGILPIANNLITAPLAMTGFPIKKLLPPLMLGNLVFPIMAASLGYYGVTLFWDDEQL